MFLSDDGEVFRVKKSSQSRRLMKQKKLEKKKNKFGFTDSDQVRMSCKLNFWRFLSLTNVLALISVCKFLNQMSLSFNSKLKGFYVFGFSEKQWRKWGVGGHWPRSSHSAAGSRNKSSGHNSSERATFQVNNKTISIKILLIYSLESLVITQ